MVDKPLLIFDLGNVLVKHDNTMLYRLFAPYCQSEALLKTTADKYLHSHHDLSLGRTTLDKVYQCFCDEAGYVGDYADFEELWSSHFSHDIEMEALIERLAKSYRTVVLSNTNHAHWNFILRNYAVMKIPHALYASHIIGVAKPDAAIYEAVLKAEHRQANEAIFIDDVAANVEGARAVGMNAILFTGRAALENDLRNYGVEI